MSQEELDQLIINTITATKGLIEERGMNAFSPLMGLVMKEARGKIDGKLVSERLHKLLRDSVALE
jgi:glutamyl-tRNA(Gln) amidotransferase subunit E